MINALLITKKEDLAYYLKTELGDSCEFIIISSADEYKKIKKDVIPDIVFFHLQKKEEKDDFLLLSSSNIAAPVVVISDVSDLSLVVFCMENGAIDFMESPDPEKIRETLRKALKKKLYNRDSYVESVLERIIGTSDTIKRLKEYLPMLAQVTETILISGESGTGKELVARTIHDISPRKDFPFVAVNCGALPASIIESEMFGTEKGAYTDAKSRPGIFEQADGGTLFLDEIGELPLDLQVKFLRVLEEKTVSRLGGNKLIPVNTRILCATNKNLKEEVQKGRFREDLYYRINILKVDLPPLRDRKTDIIALVLFFLRAMENEHGKMDINDAALEKLENYEWPGNIRELRNVISRAVVDARIKGRNVIMPDSIILD